VIGEDFNRARGSGGMNLEIWFPAQDQVTVFLESSFVGEEEQFYETMLFTLFAARQIGNGRGDLAARSLSEVLFSLDEDQTLADVEQRLAGEVTVGSPTTRGGRKGFTCQLRPEQRGSFKSHMHGFGLLGKGAGYYAPTSVLALLCWMLRRRKDDREYQLALGAAAKAIGYAGVNGMITITSQSEVASAAAFSGWTRPDELVPDDGYQPSAAALAAARNYGFDLDTLYMEALGSIRERFGPSEEGMVTIVHEEDGMRACRFEVGLAAGLINEGDPVVSAMEAVDAAKATGNEQEIELAYAHCDAVLEALIDGNGLLPVVDELYGRLFTRDVEQAH
jgi:hypothetical protein